MFKDSMTLFIENAPVVPFANFKGPALIALSQFKRTAMCHKAINRLKDIKRTMAEHDIPIGSPLADYPELPDDVMEPLLEDLGDDSFASVVQSLYRYGHPRVTPKAANKTSGNRVERVTAMKRMHIMFYDPKVDAFTVPDMKDKNYGHLFYCKEDVVRVGASKAAAKRGKEFAEFIKWRKKLWKQAVNLSRTAELVPCVPSVGQPFLKLSNTSRITLPAAEDLLIHKLKAEGEPTFPALLREQDNYNELLGEAFSYAVDNGTSVDRTAFTEYTNEVLAALKGSEQFNPCKVTTVAGAMPKLKPFDINISYDPVVFNGEPTPFM